MRKSPRSLTASVVALALLCACDGSNNSKGAGGGAGSDLRLANVEYGRLVDIYAYRRFDEANGLRRDLLNRVPTLILSDVMIDPGIESQPLFDAVGEEDPNADYQFRPFDVATGHEELLILWDDQHPDEKPRFDAALARARSGLVPVAAAYSGQNTNVQPIPVVPRNAALRLQFTRTLAVDRSFFVANPAALQVLEIVDDPRTAQPQRAFRALPYRVLVQNESLILDPSLIGGEVGAGGRTASGLPISRDNTRANIRIAIPTQTVGSGLGIKADNVAQLNGSDRQGLPSVIRDFRTGNSRDGRVGTLPDIERPMVVVDVPMGITAIDAGTRTLTLNKRGAKVAVRAAIPFVYGGIATGGRALPLGPSEVPTVAPLRSGDFITQIVPTPAGPVRVHAEVLMNLDVSNSGTLASNPNLGRAADGSDGGDAETVRVRVASLSVTGADGSPVSFSALNTPLGADCTARIHYYEYMPYSAGSLAVTDAMRRGEFVTFDPATPRIDPGTRQPIPLGTRINPAAAVSLRFSEPLEFESIDRGANFVLTNELLPDRREVGGTVYDAVRMLAEAKPAALSMLGTIPEDFRQDGTIVRLNLPMGHTHLAGQTESYWLHVLANENGPKDLAGNSLEIYDRRLAGDQRRAFSFNYTLEPLAAPNLVGVRVLTFASSDTDGTKPGSPDFFGQFEMLDGILYAAPVTRFSKIADDRTISTIVRGPNGECFIPGTTNPPPGAPAQHVTWGPLYTTPSMIQSTFPAPPPNPFTPPSAPYTYGGIGGPHNKRGVREQVTYREDDFQLGYHDPDTMMIDIEQMFWSPWTNRPVLFDQFDRYTLRMGHSRKRPDLLTDIYQPAPMVTFCGVDCASLLSGLSTNFDDNPLRGVMVDVVKDKAYTIDPAESFRGATENVYTPFPRFTRTFTWRDSRLVTWDLGNQAAIGLGGADDPTQENIPPKDTTAHVSSPWETDVFPEGVNPPGPFPTVSGYYVKDPGDFIGYRQHDHDPIALPLLMEFNLWPDQRTNGPAINSNQMHIGYVGINAHQSANWGYYNLGPVPSPLVWGPQGSPPIRANCAGMQWPSFTVMSGGYADAVGNETLIDPSFERQARGSIILDAGSPDMITGLVSVPPANDHLYWAQANFVRRVSMVTFGFFDTLQPNRHDALTEAEVGIPWPGLSVPSGIPDFQSASARRPVDFVAIMDPPTERQPIGTSVLFEVRGADTFERSDAIWNRANNNKAIERNNLFNPEYACEAYRYAMSNPGQGGISGPRVAAEGLTPYVDLDHLDTLRNPINRLLPRYLNFRLVFENDISQSAPKRPSLKSLAIIYRVDTPD